MQVLLLLLIVVGVTGQDNFTVDTSSDEKCILELKSDFILQVTANATTQVIVSRMEEFNNGLAINSNIFDEINRIVFRELKDGSSITGIIERIYIWCLITKPTDTPPTIIPVTEESELKDDPGDEEESTEKETTTEVENIDIKEEVGEQDGAEEEGGEEEGGEEEGGEEEGGEEEAEEPEKQKSGEQQTEVDNTQDHEKDEPKTEVEKTVNEEKVEEKEDKPHPHVEKPVEDDKVEEKEPVVENNGIHNTDIKKEEAQDKGKKQGLETSKNSSDQADLSYLCLIENDEEKCYLYIYPANGRIFLHEHGIPNYS